jgi:uncharacterized membrane protein YqjE
MQPADTTNSPPAPNSPNSEPTAGGPGIIEHAQILWNDFRQLTHDHLQLLSLEIQKAGENLVAMLVYGIVLSVLIICAWLGVLATMVMWLIEQDLAISAALLLTTLFNLMGVCIVMIVIRHKSRALRLPATISHLNPEHENITTSERS